MSDETKKKGILVLTKTEAYQKRSIMKQLEEDYDVVVLTQKQYDEYLKFLETQDEDANEVDIEEGEKNE